MMPTDAAPTPATIHDIIGPSALPEFPWLWIWIAAAVVVLGGILLWWLLRRKKPVPTAQQVALVRLEALHAKRDDYSSREFGFEVSEILREYISRQFGLQARSQTSLEFIESIRRHPLFNEEEHRLLNEFLEASDVLKYAGEDTTTEGKENLVQAARQVVARERLATQPVSAE